MPRESNAAATEAAEQANAAKVQRAKRYLTGVGIERDNSDDELGVDDFPWEWIYSEAFRKKQEASAADEAETVVDLLNAEAASTPSSRSSRKRRVSTRSVDNAAPEIVGARMGSFECKVGDCVLLKAEGTNEAWVGLICEFVEDEEGDMAANFMWFATEQEVRNKAKKRTDFLAVSTPILPSSSLLTHVAE